jgi:hypothetical protein
MAPITVPPIEEAKRIFTRLGYDVTGDGTDLTAERKWRTVRVTATNGDDGGTLAAETRDDAGPESDAGPEGDAGYRCFVTWADAAEPLFDRLRRTDTEYEWAIIGIDDSNDPDRYDVLHGAEPLGV